MSARHFDHRGQTACWPGRAVNFTTERREVTCANCRRTRVFKDADEVRGPTPARKRLVGEPRPDPRDAAVLAGWARRLTA